jgi:ATP-dependent exoDNAse (exonuclease V) alpha subunit
MKKEAIVQKLLKRENIFLTGGAGVGKTTLTRELIEAFEEEAKKVAKLASTGMAATLLGGQTLHSFFDFGIAESMAELEKNGKLAIKKRDKKLIASMDLIVIDEISMVSAALMDMIAFRLREAGFKGALLVVGDFLQLPPVVKMQRELFYAFESDAWQAFAFERVELKHIYRTDDKDFIKLLHRVRFGEVDEAIHNHLNSFIKPLPNTLEKYTFLFGKNISASHHNRRELEEIEGELFVLKAQIVKHKNNIKDTQIQRFMNDARVEEELALKIGAPILFSRNSWNYYNGERGVVVNIDENYLYIEKNDGKVVKVQQSKQSKCEWVERVVANEVEIVEEEVFSIYQYPVKLAFAITIHKSQGMSIENLIIATNEIFAPSQFYVALSRASNPKNLILIAPQRQWHALIFASTKAMCFTKDSDAEKS